MSLKPWREIACPHKDVLEGTFKQSEFAADISQVASGNASDEYQDAEKFFSRTFITEGMQFLLTSVVQRLAGKGGDPVIQLQTAFGGGKTHTMLAVWHLASRKVATEKLSGIPPLLDKAEVYDLPKAKIAVIDGIKLSPSQPQQYGKTTVNTLWGELAWQLLGEKGYNMVAQSDIDGTSPGKEVLKNLLKKSAPCVVLIDELLAFIRQLEPGKQFKAGTFDSNMSFIQALTEAIKTVPNAILIASLPESEVEIGGTMGARALEALEKYFARVESIWKPVASTESFEIVRRRLFDSSGDASEIKKICQQFFNYYRNHDNKIPHKALSNDYLERMCQSYPIHPEVFDRLYEDWSTLEKFQRTRGVLQYMAIIIHNLWNSNNCDAMIMPGSIALDDSNVRNKSMHYLPQGWEPILEKEVDGPKSKALEIDNDNPRFGSVQAARRVMRTIFLGSAPDNRKQHIKGLDQEHILLGCVQPEQKIGIFEDALKRLRDRLHYLYVEKERYYLDTRPNLRREMETRKRNVSNNEVDKLLKEQLSNLLNLRGSCFGGIHIFTSSADIPDDYGYGPRLVVLAPTNAYTSEYNNSSYRAAKEILSNRGNQPREKQNRLIFLAVDYDILDRLKNSGKICLAWKSIISDINNEKLDLNLSLKKQAEQNLESSKMTLEQTIREAYKWVINPSQSETKNEITWESISISPNAQNLISEIEAKLKEEEWLIFQWSPIHLHKLLQRLYFKENITDISAQKVWQNMCKYLYMPRLVNDEVFKKSIADGIATSDYFGFASGRDSDRYLGFVFSKSTAAVVIDDLALLINHDAAVAYHTKSTQVVNNPEEETDNEPDIPKVNTGEKSEQDNNEHNGSIKKRFYGTVELSPTTAKVEFADICDEILEKFTTKVGINVSISVEIDVTANNGFDEIIQRTIKENCNTLKFKNYEFEKGD